jgi:hypothetical protein
MLNLNVTLRLLSLGLVGNHQNIHLTKTPILFWRFSLLVLWDISRLVVVHMYNAVSLFHLDIGISTKADKSAMGAIMHFNLFMRTSSLPLRADNAD